MKFIGKGTMRVNLDYVSVLRIEGIQGDDDLYAVVVDLATGKERILKSNISLAEAKQYLDEALKE